MLKHFTIIEVGAFPHIPECPSIGTIDNIPNNKVGMNSFKERLTTALGEHFDVNDEDIELSEIPDLFAGSPYDDMIITIKDTPIGDKTVCVDSRYTIRIMETWIY